MKRMINQIPMPTMPKPIHPVDFASMMTVRMWGDENHPAHTV